MGQTLCLLYFHLALQHFKYLLSITACHMSRYHLTIRDRINAGLIVCMVYMVVCMWCVWYVCVYGICVWYLTHVCVCDVCVCDVVCAVCVGCVCIVCVVYYVCVV